MKILSVLAHPDDEIIFGWPIMQRKDIQRDLVLCCDNSNISKEALKASEEICAKEGINLLYEFETPAGFSLLGIEDRTEYIKELQEALKKLKNYDYVFTHNPEGEYGHPDHVLIFRIIADMFKDKTVFGDYYKKIRDYPIIKLPCITKETFGTFTQDVDFVNRCSEIYKKYRAWTWMGQKVPTEIKLWRLLCQSY